MAKNELDKRSSDAKSEIAFQAVIALYAGRYRAARELAKSIVNQSRGRGEFVLGELCRSGRDCNVDLHGARDWYVSSSIQGYFRGHFEVSMILQEDVTPPNEDVFRTNPDQKLSEIYLRKTYHAAVLAHEVGEVDATEFLGWWNCEGAFALPQLGLPSADSELGIRLLTQAVALGFYPAARYLWHFFSSKGDAESAKRWLNEFETLNNLALSSQPGSE